MSQMILLLILFPNGFLIFEKFFKGFAGAVTTNGTFAGPTPPPIKNESAPPAPRAPMLQAHQLTQCITRPCYNLPHWVRDLLGKL